MFKVGTQLAGVFFMSMVLATSAHAGNVTFASFDQWDVSGTPFQLDHNATASTFTATTLVAFQYLNITNPAMLPSALQPGNTIQAELTVTGNSSSPGTDNAGNIFQCCFMGSFTILLPVADAINGDRNLLSGTFNSGTVNGASGGSGATFNSSNTITSSLIFTSDFVAFSGTNRSMAIGMTGGTNPLSLDSSGFFNQTDLTGSALFSSDPGPSSAPEPSTVVLLGSSLIALGLWAKRRIA